ncbi:PLP-dependent aminotransferase family protein [Xenophilus arseniciresistens]|uniref:PLP-dependent aminotransferase family protein n=1 Tax=Xenophilus arseniciresistens TaxID=1283306 RepID=A0AAE3N8R5_9BURK|nr:PLP-dependent aminotransferase family protein [Xenophilus arseniciresistens]MDA7415902.1 PLP-dependent aminotransferase family protein [Xenophilus arseniciresistens]
MGRRIYDLLRSQIEEGRLASGARAPSTRALAAELGVSRTTVTAAYEQLAAEGFLLTSPGRAARIAGPPRPAGVLRGRPARMQASSVAPRLSAFGERLLAGSQPAPAPAEPVRFDFLYGAVAARDFPVLPWRRAYQAALLQGHASLGYAPAEGELALRRALQGYLGRARGLACDADQVVVVHGSQQAIDLCARLLLQAGDSFVFEDPGYLMARRCFEATGAQCLAVPVDAQGLQTDALPRGAGARLAYVTPSHQFPWGGVLPIHRRVALLQWAQREQAWIVEDDYDGEFRYGQRPIEPLQAIDTQGRVIYVGTFSKALSPQLRLGYLVLPQCLVAAFRQAKRLTDRHAPVLEQRALATLIDSGAYERHVRRVRRENERRRAALLEAVARHLPPGATVSGSSAGLHVVLWLPDVPQAAEAALVAAARQAGVGVYPLSPLYAPPPATAKATARPAGLVVGYASLSPAQIDEGMRLLGAVMAGRGRWRGGRRRTTWR